MSDGKQRVNHGSEPADFLQHASDDVAILGGVVVLLQAHLPDAAHGGQRRSKFMGNIRGKAFQPFKGIFDAAIKGMLYAVGPQMGLQHDLSRFEQNRWSREQLWMADTSLLMQMLDDWVDQEEDRERRLTPVIAGDWTLHSAQELYGKTIRDLNALLDESAIWKPLFRTLLIELYNDYLHAAINAMRSGVAA
jgi:hypothetical protein